MRCIIGTGVSFRGVEGGEELGVICSLLIGLGVAGVAGISAGVDCKFGVAVGESLEAWRVGQVGLACRDCGSLLPLGWSGESTVNSALSDPTCPAGDPAELDTFKDARGRTSATRSAPGTSLISAAENKCSPNCAPLSVYCSTTLR